MATSHRPLTCVGLIPCGGTILLACCDTDYVGDCVCMRRTLELVQHFKKELGTENYNVSWVPMTWCEGYMISVLPAAASKNAAAAFVANKYGVSAKRTVWAGDSENDKTMLSTPFRGIAVAVSVSRRSFLGVHPLACVVFPPPHEQAYAATNIC